MAEPKTKTKTKKESKEFPDLAKAKLLSLHFERFKKSRKKLDKDREEWLRAYNGEMNLRRVLRIGGVKAKATTNVIFSQIETMKPILTQNIPVVRFSPVFRTEAWTTLGEMYQKFIDRIFRRNNMRRRLVELVHHGLIDGKAFFKVVWNPEMNGGHGEVEIKVPDTRNVYMEPEKDSLDDANIVFEARLVDQLSLTRQHPRRRQEIARLFEAKRGGFLEKLKPDFVRQKDVGFSATAAGAAAATTTMPFFEILATMGEDQRQDVELVEAWLHDDEMLEELKDEIDERTGQVVRSKDGSPKKKPRLVSRYPDGRLVQFSGNMVFDDKKNEFPGLPYVEYFNYISRTQHGISEVKHILNLQKQRDIRSNQLFDIMSGQMDRMIFFDSRSGLTEDDFTNRTKPVFPVNDTAHVKVIDAPRVSGSMFDSMDKIDRDFELTTGVQEVTKGVIPGDVRSGAGIEALQELADTRLKGKSGEIEVTVNNLVRFMIPMINRFYAEGVHFVVDDDLKQTEEFKMFEKEQIHADFFDIEVEAGVNRPRSRIAQEQKQQWMFSQGMLDEEYIVTHSQLEDKDEVIEKMKPLWEAKREALLSQAQPQEPQPQEGVGGGGPV